MTNGVDTSTIINAGQFFLGFFKSFFGTPAILVGLFSLLGAILLRKKFTEIILTAFKTTAGFLILAAGAATLSIPLSNFQILFQDLFKVNGIIPNNDAFAASFFRIAPQAASLGSIIMVISILLNLVLSQFSRFKYIYLSGHVIFYMSIMLAAVLVFANNQNFINLNRAGDYALALISSALLLSSYMVVSSAFCKRFVKQISKINNITMAHSGSLSYVISGWIGEAIYKIKKGKNIKSTEAIKFPKQLAFFRNTFVSVSITMLVIFMIIYIPEGIMYSTGIKNVVNAQKNFQSDLIKLFGTNAATNWVVQMLLDAFTFAAGVEVLLFGVRMIIGEIVTNFKGISTKFIKNSQASLDCPIVFPYATNAVLIGFISSLIAGFIGMAITIGISLHNSFFAIVIPGVIPHFFLGATSGVYGNVKGGIYGCLLGSFVNGLIISFVPLVFLAGNWTPSSVLTWGDTDYLVGVVLGILSFATGVAGQVLVIVVPLLVYLGLVIDGLIKKIITDRSSKEGNVKPKSLWTKMFHKATSTT